MASTGTPEVHMGSDDRRFDKTRMCKFFAKNQCVRGEACQFAHGRAQLQPRPRLFRTTMCLDFMKAGTCHVGAACKFAHGAEDLRQPAPAPPASAASPARVAVAAAGQPVQGAKAKVDTKRFQQQLKLIELQAARLRAELQALELQGLHHLTGSAQEPERAESEPSVDLQHFNDSLEMPRGTECPPNTPDDGPLLMPFDFSRNTTEDATLPRISHQSSVGSDEWEPGFALVVKNTFLDVEPTFHMSSTRRARSVPARISSRHSMQSDNFRSNATSP